MTTVLSVQPFLLYIIIIFPLYTPFPQHHFSTKNATILLQLYFFETRVLTFFISINIFWLFGAGANLFWGNNWWPNLITGTLHFRACIRIYYKNNNKS
jgi:hypothetical protein